ncbi:hypothetical protein ABIB25_004577 [Nakamurella sp. UYEF19]|uniref:hypothetical protein n=1 Tax=Nakamurella sp. UYEF19 TaxID=1756392 RepID=UPI0033962911
MADVWMVDRPPAISTSGYSVCAVDTCDRASGTPESDRPKPADVLCLPHQRRFRKTYRSVLPAFITAQAQAPRICQPRGGAPASLS